MAEVKELLPAPTSLAEAWTLCERLSQSGLIPDIFKNKPQNILPAMMLSKSLGIPIFQGLQSIAVVNGKPTIYGDCALAVVRASGLLEDIKEAVSGNGDDMKAVCICRRKGQKSEIIGEFTVEDAKRAGLWTKDVWKKYPKRMLKMRARAYALRDGFADLLSGISVTEEMQGVEDDQPINNPGTAPMPKPMKAASKAKPAEVVEPTPVPVEAVEEAVQEEVTAVEAVEDIEPNPVQEAEPEEPVTAPDPYGVMESIMNRIASAKSYKDLILIYKETPQEYKEEVMKACSARKAELGE